MTEATQQRLDQLIADFDTAMLVTTSLEGQPRARPMAIAGHAEGGRLYFATRAEDEKLEEVLQEPEVAVTMQSANRFLSITGTAHLETDRELAEALWSPEMKIWFPDGAEDAQLAVIRIDPLCAEYWDQTGFRKLEFLWNAGGTVISGNTPAYGGEDSHAKVEPR